VVLLLFMASIPVGFADLKIRFAWWRKKISFQGATMQRLRLYRRAWSLRVAWAVMMCFWIEVDGLYET